MELNEEVVKKSLDWLYSLVGNSNDSDIALRTYQLLGILYDTCEELTKKNAIQAITMVELDKQVLRLTEENERLRAKNKKAQISIDTFRELADKHALQYELIADKVKQLERFKSYFDDLFETGLKVANWHENGELEPFDKFYISALDCMRE